jgi:sporulation protein YlmC with PRC-barrel domain
MAITVKNLSEVLNRDVFTTKGAYCGRVVDLEINLSKFRLKSLVIEAGRNSFLSNLVGGKKGVIIPYTLVENVGDVVIIKHITTPNIPEEKEEAGTEAESIATF